jgi:hypothetical protein
MSRVLNAAGTASTPRIRRIKDSVSFFRRLLKMAERLLPRDTPDLFPEPVRLHGNGPVRNITNAGTSGDSAGFVLNAPLSSVIWR